MKRALQYIISIGLTVVFLVVAFRGTDYHKLTEAMLSANYLWIAVSFAFLVASHVVRSVRWRYFLAPVKAGIPLRPLVSGVMIGYLMNNVMPRLGELARPYALARMEHIPASSAVGTVIIERILDIVTFLVLVAVLPLLYKGPLLETFPWLVPGGIVVSVTITLSLAVMMTLMIRRDWMDRVIDKVRTILPASMSDKLSGWAHAFLDGGLSLLRPGQFLGISLLTLLVWGLYALMTYAAFFAFHLEDVLDFRAAIVVLTISSIGVAIPTPGGTGSYHILTARSLTKLFQVAPSVALSYATVTHAASFLGISLIGIYFVWRDQPGFKAIMREDEVSST